LVKFGENPQNPTDTLTAFIYSRRTRLKCKNERLDGAWSCENYFRIGLEVRELGGERERGRGIG
jgi:hypothetical protein